MPREKYLTDNPLLMITGDDLFFNRLEYYLFRSMNAEGVLDFIPFEFTAIPFAVIYDKQGKRRNIINVTVEQLLKEKE